MLKLSPLEKPSSEPKEFCNFVEPIPNNRWLLTLPAVVLSNSTQHSQAATFGGHPVTDKAENDGDRQEWASLSLKLHGDNKQTHVDTWEDNTMNSGCRR